MNPGETSHSQISRGFVAGFSAAAILSTTAIFISYLSVQYKLPALVLAFWREVFVVITLVIFLGFIYRVNMRVDKKAMSYLALYGLVLALFNSLWTTSVVLNGAAVSTVLVYSSAAFTALLGRWLLKESLGWIKLLAILMSFGGCAFVAGAYDPIVWQTNLPGILIGVISGLAYAIYSLMGRTAANRGLNPWVTIMYTFAFAACLLLLTNLLYGGKLPGTAAKPMEIFWLDDAWAGWGVLVLLGAGPTVAGFGLYNVCLGYLPSSVANLIVSTEPVFTAVLAYLLLGEQLTSVQIFGGLLVLGGVAIMRIFEKETDLKP